MRGNLTREPQGRVVLTPLGLSAAMRERGVRPVRLSKRALTAQLKAQKREDGVIARQKPFTSAPLRTGLNMREYESFLRTGAL